MSNVELHLFEKAAQTLSVEPDASAEQVQAAFAEIETPSPVQKMAEEILQGTPVTTRKLIIAAWHKKHTPSLFDINMQRLHDEPRFEDTWKKERLELRKAATKMETAALSAAKEKHAATIYFVYSILRLHSVRTNTQPKRVWYNITDPIFMDLLMFAGLADPGGFEGDEKVVSIELEPHISTTSVRYEVRYRTSGKRGGETEKTINNGAAGWRRKPALLEFPDKSWTDLIFSSILKRYKDKDLSAGAGDLWGTTTMTTLGAQIMALEKEKIDYPRTIQEIERIVPLLADLDTLKKMKAADRMRRWRASHPDKSVPDKEARNKYMMEYRAKRRDTLRENQKEYTRKWREKQKEVASQ